MLRSRTHCSVTILSCLVAGIIVGCNPPQPTSFAAGDDEATLDGASIAHEGSDFELTIDADRQALSRVEIDNGKRSIEFDTEIAMASGVPVPTTIVSGQNELDIDLDSGRAVLSVSVPFQGTQMFELRVDDGLALFGLERVVLQNEKRSPCERQVAGVDEFCEVFESNSDMAMDGVITLAQQNAADAGIPAALNGMIEGIVREFFDVMLDFCDAWTTVRDGGSESSPVDPCDEIS